MAGFTKLFSEIVTSSIWSEDDKTRLVWITLLALVDNPKGEVPASIPGLANAARVSIKDCEKAVKILESPDEYSRTKEHEGRRIQPIDGGWLIINYEKHRNRESSDPRKVADRERQRRHRAQMSRDSHVMSCDVASASASVSDSSSEIGGAGGKVDGYTLEHCLEAADKLNIPASEAEAFHLHYCPVGWIDGAGRKITNLPRMLQKWHSKQIERPTADQHGRNLIYDIR